ncbi:N-6 DNA Methylase [Paraburkholderia phenazinium]|uniref:N-6 DNA Methylase n=1 Tax=Paraburkholderia phenazinium TaxID=60549 RepID=A0A1G7YEC5_9BURK|nr:N-6 DNA methylase [Paraburkholderia phenazinium]SDG94733.1 N-6 DNA Methylase [Paraburkholderia phenazinium]
MTTFDTVCSAATTGDPHILHKTLPKNRKEALKALTQGLDVPGQECTDRFKALLYGGMVRFASDGFRDQAGLRTSYHGPIDTTGVNPSVSTALFMLYATAVRYSVPFTDVLGDLYTKLLAKRGGDGLGQYFTPPDLADLAAAPGIDFAVRRGDEMLTIHEPTCGAGGLLLALFRDRENQPGLRPEDRLIQAQDLDPLCCAMTALQFCMNAFVHQRPIGELIVRCGNTLAKDLNVPLFFHAHREGWVRPVAKRAREAATT